jgi:hypothetical protein
MISSIGTGLPAIIGHEQPPPQQISPSGLLYSRRAGGLFLILTAKACIMMALTGEL